MIECDQTVVVTDGFDRKIAALRTHESQPGQVTAGFEGMVDSHGCAVLGSCANEWKYTSSER